MLCLIPAIEMFLLHVWRDQRRSQLHQDDQQEPERSTDLETGTQLKVEYIPNCKFQPHNSYRLLSLLSWLMNKQETGSQEPGGKQDQDTGDLFFISTSLTRLCYSDCKDGRGRFLLFARHKRGLAPCSRYWQYHQDQGYDNEVHLQQLHLIKCWYETCIVYSVYYFRAIECRWNIAWGRTLCENS